MNPGKRLFRECSSVSPRLMLCGWVVMVLSLLAHSCGVLAAEAQRPPESSEMPWAFRAVAHPPQPSVSNASWPLTSIDRFILARLEGSGLSPALDADRYTWLWRVTFDLTGLPPTIGEVETFI